MKLHKHAIALGLAMVIDGTASGTALAQGMGSGQDSMMEGDSQRATGFSMMGGSKGGMGLGMMDSGMMPCPMMGEGMGMMSMLDPEQRSNMRDLMTDEQREQLQQAEPEALDPDDHDAHH